MKTKYDQIHMFVSEVSVSSYIEIEVGLTLKIVKI